MTMFPEFVRGGATPAAGKIGTGMAAGLDPRVYVSGEALEARLVLHVKDGGSGGLAPCKQAIDRIVQTQRSGE